jgi:hypothetical protein
MQLVATLKPIKELNIPKQYVKIINLSEMQLRASVTIGQDLKPVEIYCSPDQIEKIEVQTMR